MGFAHPRRHAALSDDAGVPSYGSAGGQISDETRSGLTPAAAGTRSCGRRHCDSGRYPGRSYRNAPLAAGFPGYSSILENGTTDIREPVHGLGINLRPLELVAVVHINGFPLGVEIQGGGGGFAMAVAGLFGSTEGQVG